MIFELITDHGYLQVGYDMTKAAAKKLYQKTGM